ncbi:glycosyltransferase family 4 protein [Carboxylicivirga caseinilyticus]|uniref:glycosyltransferase family 4 protein n=1 Tax=Carboxylicivirga caseinilyticus TaxID=3417572 RepID=UPI003D330C55|nr:glycosyltransferase family 4 protein [Marinilabiliaceae bacterium A049]
MGKAPVPSICFVIPQYVTFSTGGAEIQVFYLINEFLSRGWEVELLCGGKGKEHSIICSPYLDHRVKYHYYKFRSIRFLEFFSVFFLLFKTKSNIYYQRTDFSLTGACALYCMLLGKKMIYALAQDKDAEKDKYTNALKSFRYKSKLKKLIRKTDFIIVDKMVEWGKKNADLILAQNRHQQIQFKKSFKRLTELIPSSFPSMQSDLSQKENIVLWVGNVSPVKQPELFLKIVNGLRNVDDWRFIMIGKGTERLSYLVSGNIETKGELGYQETLGWFDKARIFVNTSSAEGMPNTFIQSWFKQVAVVSLSVDPDNLLKENQLGYCFDNDIKEMTDFIDQLLTDNIKVDDILDKAYRYATKTFDVKKNLDRLIELISN